MWMPDRNEIFRYLGYRDALPDEEVRNKTEECLALLERELEPREIHRTFPLHKEDEDTVCIETMRVHSRSLASHLRDCREVCLMAATIGLGPDRLAARASAEKIMSRAVIFDAAGSALIEAWCDEVCSRIASEVSSRGLFLRPRFSPGYGDFSLSHQTDLFRILNVHKSIGTALTESLLMIPSKSVTAVIGLSDTDAGCASGGCENCARSEGCAYSRIR